MRTCEHLAHSRERESVCAQCAHTAQTRALCQQTTASRADRLTDGLSPTLIYHRKSAFRHTYSARRRRSSASGAKPRLGGGEKTRERCASGHVVRQANLRRATPKGGEGQARWSWDGALFRGTFERAGHGFKATPWSVYAGTGKSEGFAQTMIFYAI